MNPCDVTITFLKRVPLALEKRPNIKEKETNIFLEMLIAHLVMVTDVRVTLLETRVYSDVHKCSG